MRTKCVEKTSVVMWGQSRDPRELPGVTATGPRVAGVLPLGGRGVTFGIRADPRGYTGVCGSGVRACGAWRVWPAGTRHGTWAGTGRMDVCQEGTFLA